MPENKIWYLLTSLIKATKTLHARGMPHGDIQPRTVHITRGGNIKLLNNNFLMNNQPGYSKMILSSSKYKSTLSPLLMASMVPKKQSPVHDLLLSDIWSIGMTVMCACTNESFENFYDFGNCSIRYDLVKRNFERMVKIGYSEQLIQMLSEMLEETEFMRLKLHQIEEFLELIMKMRDFEEFATPEKSVSLRSACRGTSIGSRSVSPLKSRNFSRRKYSTGKSKKRLRFGRRNNSMVPLNVKFDSSFKDQQKRDRSCDKKKMKAGPDSRFGFSFQGNFNLDSLKIKKQMDQSAVQTTRSRINDKENNPMMRSYSNPNIKNGPQPTPPPVHQAPQQQMTNQNIPGFYPQQQIQQNRYSGPMQQQPVNVPQNNQNMNNNSYYNPTHPPGDFPIPKQANTGQSQPKNPNYSNNFSFNNINRDINNKNSFGFINQQAPIRDSFHPNLNRNMSFVSNSNQARHEQLDEGERKTLVKGNKTEFSMMSTSRTPKREPQAAKYPPNMINRSSIISLSRPITPEIVNYGDSQSQFKRNRSYRRILGASRSRSTSLINDNNSNKRLKVLKLDIDQNPAKLNQSGYREYKARSKLNTNINFTPVSTPMSKKMPHHTPEHKRMMDYKPLARVYKRISTNNPYLSESSRNVSTEDFQKNHKNGNLGSKYQNLNSSIQNFSQKSIKVDYLDIDHNAGVNNGDSRRVLTKLPSNSNYFVKNSGFFESEEIIPKPAPKTILDSFGEIFQNQEKNEQKNSKNSIEFYDRGGIMNIPNTTPSDSNQAPGTKNHLKSTQDVRVLRYENKENLHPNYQYTKPRKREVNNPHTSSTRVTKSPKEDNPNITDFMVAPKKRISRFSDISITKINSDQPKRKIIVRKGSTRTIDARHNNSHRRERSVSGASSRVIGKRSNENMFRERSDYIRVKENPEPVSNTSGLKSDSNDKEEVLDIKLPNENFNSLVTSKRSISSKPSLKLDSFIDLDFPFNKQISISDDMKREKYEQDPTIIRTQKIKLANGNMIKRKIFITTSRTIIDEKLDE